MAPLNVVWPPPAAASKTDPPCSSLYVPSVGHAARSAMNSASSRPNNPRSRSTNSGFRFNLQNGSATSLVEPGHARRQDSVGLNTLPDPRNGSSPLASGKVTPLGSRTPSGDGPDLNHEVATLSAKLVNAINHQTNLDDQLQSSRHELTGARKRIAQLENELHEHRRMVDNGLLVKRSDSERAEQALKSKLEEENQRRTDAEKDKKGMELELEMLTSQLFEEANRMVAEARQEKELSDRKTDQMKNKLQETELLLANHQEQLRDLKKVMQQLQSTSNETTSQAGTTPSTPVLSASFDRPPQPAELHAAQDSTTPTQVMFPESPLTLSHLIQPVVRTDLQTFDEFVSLLKTTQHASSRVTSGSSFGGLNLMGLGGRETPQPSEGSSAPVQSPSVAGSMSTEPPSPTNATNLKDTKFYKRVLVEDIEPTLRLDLAPGLSWLARRSVTSAMLMGSLIVEPFPASSRFYSEAFSCSLCGEVRKDYDYIRRHRFKTSDSDDAQRYPLCDYCLARVRSVCDFMGFMRLARKGHYRNESAGECRFAWEESIRLRERMFWSRVGGGVVPAVPGANTVPHSPVFVEGGVEDRSSSDAIRPGRTLGGGMRKRLSEIQSQDFGSQLKRQQSLPEDETAPKSIQSTQPARASLAGGEIGVADGAPELVPRKSRPNSLSPARRAAAENSMAHAADTEVIAEARQSIDSASDSPALVVSRDTTPVVMPAREESPAASSRHLSPSRPATSGSQTSTTSNNAAAMKKNSKVSVMASRFQTEAPPAAEPSHARSRSPEKGEDKPRQKIQIPGAFG